MSGRTLAALTLLATACAEQAPAPDVLVARVAGRLERHGGDGFVGYEHVEVLDGADRLLCEDERPLSALRSAPCADCALTLDVDPVEGVPACTLGDADRVRLFTEGRWLALAEEWELEGVVGGWLRVAEERDGLWTTFSEGALDGAGLAWHHELELSHTDTDDLADGEAING